MSDGHQLGLAPDTIRGLLPEGAQTSLRAPSGSCRRTRTYTSTSESEEPTQFTGRPPRPPRLWGRLPYRTSETLSSVTRPRLLGYRANRMAHLAKMIRRRRTARTLRGDWSERDAPLWQAEGYWLVSRLHRSDAHGRVPAHEGCPWSATARNAGQGIARGARLADQSAGPGVCARAGFRLPRGSAHALDGLRLSAPTHGTSVPLPGPKGLPDTGDAESARGNLAGAHGPHLTRGSLVSARCSYRVCRAACLSRGRGCLSRSAGQAFVKAVLISPSRA